MQKETDIQAVIEKAILFLHIKPKENDGQLGKFFIKHPILETSMTILPSTNKMFDIFNEPETYSKWVKETAEFFRKQKSVFGLTAHIRKSYRLAFFKYINEYLSEQDFAELLKIVWIQTEFNSDTTNVSQKEMVNWFRTANKKYLMDDKERNRLSSLPNGVSVCRGVRSADYKYGMSWTLNYNKAKWFAERFDAKTPIIYKTIIQKEDILAYINERNEQEVILDPDVLKRYEIEEVEE